MCTKPRGPSCPRCGSKNTIMFEPASPWLWDCYCKNCGRYFGYYQYMKEKEEC